MTDTEADLPLPSEGLCRDEQIPGGLFPCGHTPRNFFLPLSLTGLKMGIGHGRMVVGETERQKGGVSPSGQARRAGDYARVTLREGRVRQHMELRAQGLPEAEGVSQALGRGGDEIYQHRKETRLI